MSNYKNKSPGHTVPFPRPSDSLTSDWIADLNIKIGDVIEVDISPHHFPFTMHVAKITSTSIKGTDVLGQRCRLTKKNGKLHFFKAIRPETYSGVKVSVPKIKLKEESKGIKTMNIQIDSETIRVLKELTGACTQEEIEQQVETAIQSVH